MTDSSKEPCHDAYVAMDIHDPALCAEGWSPVEDRPEGGGCVRWLDHQARTYLKAPQNTCAVGIELWAPAGAPRFIAQLTVRDRWVGQLPEYSAYLDVGFRMEPGKWQTLEFSLPEPPPLGSDVEVLVCIDRPATPSSRRKAAKRCAAVRRIWLRGTLVRDACVTMGVNDATHCVDGWSPVEDWRAGGAQVRWMNGRARIYLKAPESPSVVAIELCAPAGAPPLTARLTVQDRWVGNLPGYGPYLDVGFVVSHGPWQTIDFPLQVPPQPGSDVEVIIGIAPGCQGRVRKEQRHGVAVRRLWLHGVSPKEVTIIVLNWNRAEETISCLESLDQADLEGASVLVVDNGSRDDSIAAIQSRFPKQWTLALPENTGYAGGNNAGIRAALEAGAKAVLLLNNDTRVGPDFLRPLLWVLNSDAKMAAVASSILRMDRPDTLDVAYLDIYFGHGIVHRRGVNALPGEGFDRRRKVEVAIGCSVLLNAETLRQIGSFDESYFAYHEEVDWCFRAREAGYHIYYQPFSRVWHGISKSTQSPDQATPGDRIDPTMRALPNPIPLSWNPVRTYLGARNAVRFVRAHGTLAQKAYFVCSTLYAVPLELLAIVMNREEALMLGIWSYRKALALYCFHRRHESPAESVGPLRRLGRYLAGIILLPVTLFWSLPRDLRLTHREGRTAQLVEQCRGLWDGVLARPLPLERLKLR